MNKINFIFIAKLLFLTVFFTGLSFFNPESASASIGLIEMRSTNSEDYRCFASSLIMPNNRYDVAINCVNLIFPINPTQNAMYMVWATPTTGKNPIKLGDLQKGLVRFDAPVAFSALYVTIEYNPNVRLPSSAIVMNGGVQPISFLQRPTTPTPTPEVKEGEPAVEKKPDTSTLTTREKLFLALRRAGIAAVIALVAIVGLIFVVTRSRG